MKKKLIKKHLDNHNYLSNLLDKHRPAPYISRRTIFLGAVCLIIFIFYTIFYFQNKTQQTEALISSIKISENSVKQNITYWLLFTNKKIRLTDLTEQNNQILNKLSKGTLLGYTSQDLKENPQIDKQQGIFLGGSEIDITSSQQLYFKTGRILGYKKLHSFELTRIIKNIIITSYLLNQIDLLSDFSVDLRIFENAHIISQTIPKFPYLTLGKNIAKISYDIQSFMSETTLLHRKIQDTLQIPLTERMNQIQEDKTETVDNYIYYLKALREQALDKLRVIHNYKGTLALQNEKVNKELEQTTKLLSNAIEEGNQERSTFYSQQYSDKNIESSKIKTNYKIYNKLYKDLETDVNIIRDRLSKIYDKYVDLVL